jgi:hypothetical protein
MNDVHRDAGAGFCPRGRHGYRSLALASALCAPHALRADRNHRAARMTRAGFVDADVDMKRNDDGDPVAVSWRRFVL